jgi:phage baseplate assembly protein W
MQKIQGSMLSFPVIPDVRGTLKTISNKSEIIEQSIMAILETRQGERVMLPDYGMPDFIFEVMDVGFTARLAYYVELQIKNYEPLVENVRSSIGFIVDETGLFVRGFTEDQQIAAISIQYTERGSNTPRNLVYPTWRLLPV